MIRIEYHKEHICRCGRCAWLVWVICMAPRVPTAGLCPRILFRMVTRSLGCFCRTLGCCVRRLTTLAISAFIFPCPQRTALVHATSKSLKLSTLVKQFRQKAIQGSMRNMQGSPWGFAGFLGCLQSRSYAPTRLMYFVHVPISQHGVTRSPQKTLSVESQGTNVHGKITCFIFCCSIYMNCQDDHFNTMRTM